MTNIERTLFNPGEDGETVAHFSPREFFMKTYHVGSAPDTKNWTDEEIIALLNDGMKYRLMKKAEEYKKE